MKRLLPILAVLLVLAAAPAAFAKGSGVVHSSAPTQTGCYHYPGTLAEETASIEACGYPGFRNTGPDAEGTTKCSGFPAEAGKEITSNNTTIEGKRITSAISIAPEVKNVTLNRDCITVNGGDGEGTKAIELRGIVEGEVARGAPENVKITNSVIRGGNSLSESIEEAIANNTVGGSTSYAGTEVKVEGDLIYNCAECVHGSIFTAKNNFVYANGREDKKSGGTAAHFEDFYLQTSTDVIEHNTIFNPEPQTAGIFAQAFATACRNHLTITNNFIAGGGAMIYPCANSTSVGTSTSTIEGNRFARCLGTPKFEPESGGTECTGGPDTHGFYPFGGFFFVASAAYEGAGQVWKGNFWDDNLEACTFNTGKCPS